MAGKEQQLPAHSNQGGVRERKKERGLGIDGHSSSNNAPQKSELDLLTPSSENYPWALWTRQRNPSRVLDGRGGQVRRTDSPSPSVPFRKEREGEEKAALNSVSLLMSVCWHLMNLLWKCFDVKSVV